MTRVIIELSGPEEAVNQALEELISNAEYDSLDVRIAVFVEHRATVVED